MSPFGHKIIPQWQDILPRLHRYLNTILFICQQAPKVQIIAFLILLLIALDRYGASYQENLKQYL